jgi:hypothetical protein
MKIVQENHCLSRVLVDGMSPGTELCGRTLPRRRVILGVAALAGLTLAGGCADRRICRDTRPSGKQATRLAVVPCPDDAPGEQG